MIAADTSSWIAYGDNLGGADCEQLAESLASQTAVMAPPVVAELHSIPRLGSRLAAALASIPELPVLPGYWQRAGVLRARVLAKGRRARLGDALIAQSCLDHGVALLTRDRDFRAFAAASDLVLLLG